MFGLTRYLAGLNASRIVLWCYAIWYVVNVTAHFEARPNLWLTSLGLSGVIGFALLLSTGPDKNKTSRKDPWVVFRLFLMPFCVSSFGALVKGKGYILIFPPDWRLNLIGAGLIASFVLLVNLLKLLCPPAPVV